MPDRRPRVLFIAEAVTLAHVARARVLAGYLDPARYEVHAAWDPRYNSLIGDVPFACHVVHTLPTELFLKRLARGAPMHDAETLRQNVRDDLALIERVKPDVVVGDFRLSLAASAKLARVPHVAVANAYWSPYGGQSFEFSEYDYPLSSVLGHRLAQSLFRGVLRPIGFAAHTRPLNTVLRENGMGGIGDDIRTMYTWGDFTAYADIPELTPLHEAPPNHRFIGAVIWSPDVPIPWWWNDLPTDRPVIYVTPGSSGEGSLVPTVLEALGNMPVSVIAATAGRIQLDDVPPNTRVADFIPGLAAAARSRLVICNGGSPTAYQALTSGVPVFGLASNNMDQHLNMEAVRRAGAGEVRRARGVTVAQIRRSVERLLGSSSYAEAAGRLRLAHQSCPAATRFPALLDTALGRADGSSPPFAPSSR